MNISTFGLNYDQAKKLTNLVKAVLIDLDLASNDITIDLVQFGDDCLWQVPGYYTDEQQQFIVKALKDLALVAGASWLGHKPIAFYLANKLNIKVFYYLRQCLSFDDINSKNCNNFLTNLVDQKYDAVWGQMEVSEIDPFKLITIIDTGVEKVTVVQWQTVHYLDAEHYRQYKARGLIKLGAFF